MTDTTVAPAAAGADTHPSQIIEHRDTSEIPRAGALPEGDAPKEAAKPLSTRDAIAKAFDEADKASKADAPKADVPPVKADDTAKAKPDETAPKPRAEDGKFAKAQTDEETEAAKAEKGAPAKAATGQEVSERRTSEGRHPEPPARFLPEARAAWPNVPNAVKTELHRYVAELEQQSEGFKASHERYSQLKDFDDLARSNGRDLRESLTKVNEIENALQQNPIAGLDAVLREVGPRRQDGSPLTIMDVAQYLTQNPQAYQPGAPAPQPQQGGQQQPHPDIARLTEQVNALVANQTVVPVIERFSDAHPDFDALSPKIEQILTSGVIEKLYGTGLSLEQRLSEAHRMAGGQSPSSRSDSELAPAHFEVAPVARPVDPDGQKSIKGAPTAGQTGEPKWVPKTNREALERAFAAR